MLNKLDRNWLAAALLVTSIGTFAASLLAGLDELTGPMLSTGGVAALVALFGLFAAVGRLDWAAGGAMASGAWSLVAPVILGFTSNAAFWIHIAAGLVAMSVGIRASELLDRGPPQSFA